MEEVVTIDDAYQPLFDLMKRDHNRIVLKSEMDDIIEACELVTENIRKLLNPEQDGKETTSKH